MRPFMHAGGTVELAPTASPPLVGDVLLVRCGAEGERYVLHRLVREKGGELFIRGDAQEHCEGPFTQKDVLGRVVTYFSNERAYRFDSGFWHFLGQAWRACFPLSVRLLRLAVHLRGEVGVF